MRIAMHRRPTFWLGAIVLLAPAGVAAATAGPACETPADFDQWQLNVVAPENAHEGDAQEYRVIYYPPVTRCIELDWRVDPIGYHTVDGKDFGGTSLPRGHLRLEPDVAWDGEPMTVSGKFKLRPIDDHKTEKNETFQIVLSMRSDVWGNNSELTANFGGSSVIWTSKHHAVVTVRDTPRECLRLTSLDEIRVEDWDPDAPTGLRGTKPAVARSIHRRFDQCAEVGWRVEPGGPRPIAAAALQAAGKTSGVFRFSVYSDESDPDSDTSFIIPLDARTLKRLAPGRTYKVSAVVVGQPSRIIDSTIARVP